MEAVLVSVSTGVMKPLLAKLSKLLEQEHGRIKGVHHQIAFLKDELGSMKAALETLADAEQLDDLKEEWRDMVRELAYDIKDCIDVGVDHEHGEEEEDEEPTATGFIKGFFRRFKKLKARRELAGQIQQLKSRATEASERHKRYNFVEPAPNSSTCAVDPRLPALYEDVDKLVGIHGPREHIIEWFSRKEHDENLKVLAVVGSGGLGTLLSLTMYGMQIHGKLSALLCSITDVVAKLSRQHVMLRLHHSVRLMVVMFIEWGFLVSLTPEGYFLKEHLVPRKYAILTWKRFLVRY